MTGQNNDGTSTLRVIRVFLASPSDLGEERRSARAAVDEINKTVARPAGFHVDLIGWEDTLSSAGRPQAVINEDLETCQMFIGMLWARWGTAPDIDGRYSSGFEEEFSLASARNASNGEPHITLFFKDVEESKLIDAGPELSKVLAFKTRVIAEKKVLFEVFFEPNGFGQKVRLSISSFIHKLSRSEKSVRSDISSNESHPRTSPDVTSGSGGMLTNGSFDDETSFLAMVGQTVARKNETLSAVDVARLRNIAVVHGQTGNDDITVGAYDANLLYQNRNKFKFSVPETAALTDAGLEAISDENKPLWSWLAGQLKRLPPWLIYSTVSGPERRRIGAFRAMKALRATVVEDEFLKMSQLGDLWFGELISSSVKNAALEYIGEVANADLVALAEQQFDENNYATRKAALEAVVRVRGRSSVRDAASYALSTSFDVLGDASMAIVLAGMQELGDETLNDALEHRAGAIRGKAIEILAKRKKLTDVQMRRFFGDVAIEARCAAVAAFETNVRPLSDEEAKEALVTKEVSNALGIRNSDYDHKGQEAFDERKRRRLSRRSYAELEDDAKTDILNAEDYYFAIAEAHFSKVGEQLRVDVDDRFVSYWKNYLDAVRAEYGPSRAGDQVADLFNKHQGFRRRTYVRRALDVLVVNSDPQDLSRVRRALDEDAADPSFADIEYFRRWGEWEDIPRIAKIANDHRSVGGMAALFTTRVDLQRPALAILKLASERLNELALLDISPEILAKVIGSMSIASFRKLGRVVIEELLQREADMVRKATALQVLNAFGVRQADAYLTRYLDPSKPQYYNVIFWLDLCNAWDRETYRQIAQRELQRVEY